LPGGERAGDQSVGDHLRSKAAGIVPANRRVDGLDFEQGKQ
jgi:hypothetical protein